jgi:hypothetical protein
LLEHTEGLPVKARPDWMALPQQHGPSMPFFKPGPNTLDPYQRQLCADTFKQTWAAIIPTGCRLPTEEEIRLEHEVSDRLCFFAARGVVDPQTLQGLTVATVKLHQRAKPPLRGRHVKRHPERWSAPLRSTIGLSAASDGASDQ